jgi:hypothetical protein
MASAIIHIREYEDYPLLETDSTDSFYREYQVTDQGRIVSVQQPNQHNRRWRPQQLLQTPARVVQELFLPIGFPSSVNQGYLEYQFYDSLQGLCSYLRGVLCTAKVLQAAGVGKGNKILNGRIYISLALCHQPFQLTLRLICLYLLQLKRPRCRQP